jgi:hypothetical protein
MGREFRGFERAIQLHQAYLKDELPAVSSQVDLDTWVALRGDLLSYILANLGDRQEMSHGLEGRTPFLDSDLAQLACRLHPSELIFGLREKHALRKLLPPELKQVGRKHPFFAPPRLLQAPKAQDFLLDHCQSLRGWIPEFDFGRFDVLVREMQADPARQKILGEMRLYLASTHIILSQLDQLSPAARVFGEVPAPKDGEIYFSPVFRSLPVAQRGIA